MKLHTKMYGWQYVWREFADSKQGQVEGEDQADSYAIRLPVPGKPWTISFFPRATKSKKGAAGTTAVVAFQSHNGFAFRIFNEKKTSAIGKLFGMEDIQIGDAEFDSKFIVQATEKLKVVELFGNLALRDLILEQQGNLDFKIIDDAQGLSPEWQVPAGYKALVFTQDTLIDDYERLSAIFTLLVGILEGIRAVGANKLPGQETIPPKALRSIFLK